MPTKTKTGFESGAPAGRTRERVVEAMAGKALAAAEDAEAEAFRVDVESRTRDKELQSADRATAEGALAAVLNSLPDDCVWLLPEATQAVRDSGVYSAAYEAAYMAGTVRIRDWFMDLSSRGHHPQWAFLDEQAYICLPEWRPGLATGATHFGNRAAFEASRDAAASEIAQAARDDVTRGLVTQVCESFLRDHGLNWFQDNYCALWAKYTRSAGIVWKGYPRQRGQGEAYE